MERMSLRRVGASPLDRASRRAGAGGRGRGNRLRRRGGAGGIRSGGSGRPARSCAWVSFGPWVFARRPPGHLDGAAAAGAGRRGQDGVRIGRRAGRASAGCPRQPHLRRGPSRRRTDRAGVGEDLRIEGVVVEQLGGVDDLVDIVAEFAPGPGRRLGVLVDHLVPGSKEARIADAVRRGRVGPTRWSSATPTSTSGRRSNRSGWAWRPGRRCPGTWSGSTACAGRCVCRTPIRPTSPGRGGTSVRGCVTGTTSSRR